MQLHCHKTLWGHEGDLQSAIVLAQEAGFTGIEAPAPQDAAQRERDAERLAAQGMRYIAEICTAGSYVPDRHASPAEHLADFEQKLIWSRALNPRFCNVMAGCDAWPLAVQVDFFRRAMDLADKHQLLCSFETHRGRSFFNPWQTRDILAQLPDLLITCDFSHWVVVCERLMDVEMEIIQQVAEHAHHVHGRVGYDQGPQVPHPAAPEYAEALASHQRCWEVVWRAQHARGYQETTLTPEFGPDGSLHTLPFTHQPVADLWQINRWIGQTEQQHFSQWYAHQVGVSGQMQSVGG